jgi:hypothetical protein
MQDYRIERLSIDNISHLQSLYRSIYSKDVSIELLKGKYNTMIFGAEWIGYLAITPDNIPAAFYGVIPCRFRIRGEVHLAAQSADTMTHPDHRKKGLFIQLARLTYELARQEGIQFIFGFPNQNSYSGFVKLKWHFVERPMQLFLLMGSDIPWAKAFLKIPGLAKVYEKMIAVRYPDHVENKDFSEGDGVVRDQVFFDYKRQYSNTFVKRANGIFAWMKNDGSLKIGLISFDDSIHAQSVKYFLQNSARVLGCHPIILMTSFNSRLYETLSKVTPPRVGLPIGFYNLTDRHFNFDAVKFEYCDIDVF